MSKTFRGNLTGALIAILGCLAGYGAYRIEFEWGMIIGLGIALFGATIINPLTIREGAREFKANASELKEVISLGRRASDGKAEKIDGE